MEYLCLDLEGVLVPEIWAEVAKHTGEEKFNLTTQDIKDYSELMDMRMELVNSMNLSMSDINNLVANMEPFEGSLDFLVGDFIFFISKRSFLKSFTIQIKSRPPNILIK